MHNALHTGRQPTLWFQSVTGSIFTMQHPSYPTVTVTGNAAFEVTSFEFPPAFLFQTQTIQGGVT